MFQPKQNEKITKEGPIKHQLGNLRSIYKTNLCGKESLKKSPTSEHHG